MSKALIPPSKSCQKILSNFGMVENTGTGYTGTDMRVSGIRINKYTDIRIQNFDI